MPGQRGKGSRLKRHVKDNERAVSSAEASDPRSMPLRRLEQTNFEDCQHAVRFARGVLNEVKNNREEQERMLAGRDGRDKQEHHLEVRSNSSIYGFFGKSSLLMEALLPVKMRRRHLVAMLGVPGCGKTRYLQSLLEDIFGGSFRVEKPSVLVCSSTNSQCRNLFAMMLSLHNRGLVPAPHWCVSQEWLKKDETHVLHSMAEPRPFYPRGDACLVVATHDFASFHLAASYFTVVMPDEIGALDLYRGCCLLGLARQQGVLMGDPLQGRRPGLSLADVHAIKKEEFLTHSYRCPEEVMKIVEPAYQAQYSCALTLTGVEGRGKWLVQTWFDKAAIELLQNDYGDNVIVMGFTHEAITDIAESTTVDAAVGLQAAIAVLIFEEKRGGKSHQYDIKRLVPALTRATHGLVIMWWSRRSYHNIPWKNISSGDGTQEVYNRLTRVWWVEDPKRAVGLFLEEHAKAEILQQVNEDLRGTRYEDIQKLVAECTACAAEDLLMIENAPPDGDVQLQLSLQDTEETDSKLEATEAAAETMIEGGSGSDECKKIPNKVVPTDDHHAIAELLAGFVAETVSHVYVESRGHVHWASPKDKMLKKAVFQTLQHNEEGEDQGNATYNTIYDLWVAAMELHYPAIVVPTNASQVGVSPAGNIVETWKMIAETVLKDKELDENATLCVRAAELHLKCYCAGPGKDHALYTTFEAHHGFCGIAVWINGRRDNARFRAGELLKAFKAVLGSEDSEEIPEPAADAAVADVAVKRMRRNTMTHEFEPASYGSSDEHSEYSDSE